ncbi:MAG: TonB C-terminal domain-containing protein [Nitrospira sp.]|nr:TonB C-terminal domain-containing protein [Nitrospira sp.]
MGEIDSTSHLTYRVLFIIVTLLFGSAFSLVGEIWNTSQSAIAAEIPSSNAYQPEVNKPCKLLSHTTPRGKFFRLDTGSKADVSRAAAGRDLAPRWPLAFPRTKPDARLRVAGGLGPTLIWRVQARIAGFWTSPPVDKSGRGMTVVVGFRLERDGRISSVTVEQSSGNEQYDHAARQAVQNAVPLPPFPPDLPNMYFDAHYTFSVGEASGALDYEGESRSTGDSASMVNNHRDTYPIEVPISRQLDDCQKFLDMMLNAIYKVPESQEGLDILQSLSNELPLGEHEETNSNESSELQWLARDLHRNVRDRRKEITEKLAEEIKWREYDSACEKTVRKAKFPLHLRDEPVAAWRQETKTLGRAFCTAVQGGGKVEFRVIDEKTPTVGIFVTTTKRRFVVILQKKMQGDLSEAWTAVEIQTPSDRRPAVTILGQTFMDGFPNLVQND